MSTGEGVAIVAFHRFLAAVASRDPDAVVACFTPGAGYANVPHPAAVGHDAIRAMFAPILERSTEVRWDVVTEATEGTSVLAERVDRFVIDGTECAARCCGVYVVEPDSGLIAEVRDYVDLGPWRASLDGVL